MSSLLEFLEVVTGLLAFGSVFACALGCIALIMSYAFKRCSAATQHSLWLATVIWIVAIPFFAPYVPTVRRASPLASVASPVSLYDSLRSETEALSVVSVVDTDVSPKEPRQRRESIRPMVSEKKSESLFSLTNSHWKNLAIVVVIGIWLLGLVVFVYRICSGRRVLKIAFGDSVLQRGELREELERLASSFGTFGQGHSLRTRFKNLPELYVSRGKHGPLVWGCVQPRILLPHTMESYSPDELRAVLTHELAHIIRGDEWTRCFLLIARTVFWFHPVVRFCCNRVQLCAEKACDDYVLRRGHRPHLYSEFLLKVQTEYVPTEFLTTSSGMAQSQVALRVRSILDSSKSREPHSMFLRCSVHVVMIGCSILFASMRPAIVSGTEDGKRLSQTNGRSGSIGVNDWPQWGGSPSRNNLSPSTQVPIDWDVESGKNIRWSVPLGSEFYGGVVVANGQVYTGTNNGAGYLDRYPNSKDLGVLLAFRESNGDFLWQHSNEKLPTGRVHDWPLIGVCSAPCVDGDRLWYVTNRCEVVCLDTQGFQDNENDGVNSEVVVGPQEADVVWKVEMMSSMGVEPQNLSNCSVTSVGGLLFLNTSNGHHTPNAPSFVCMDRNTGMVLWNDHSPNPNILHGQWSSPAYAEIDGIAQVIFGGGDGYVYGFQAEGENGKSKLLWKFDCNPKDSIYMLNGATRNHIIATPVIVDGLVYIGVGEDLERGEGPGHLWCIDPTKRGDISPTLVYNATGTIVPHVRKQALDRSSGDVERTNPNSGMVWHYQGSNPDNFHTSMHRTVSTVAIDAGLLFVADTSGLFHCVDAKTGVAYWTDDLLAACWASPLIANGRVYIGDEDGDLKIFERSKTKTVVAEHNFAHSIYMTPIVANDTLFIGTRNRLWAIKEGAQLSR